MNIKVVRFCDEPAILRLRDALRSLFTIYQPIVLRIPSVSLYRQRLKFRPLSKLLL